MATYTIDTDIRGSDVGRANYESNNPFNIIYVKRNNWYGKIPIRKSRFERFYHIDWGIRAGFVLLKNKYSGKTIEQIVYRFAPSHENDTENYIRLVLKFGGFKNRNQILNLNNKETLKRLGLAKLRVEDIENYNKTKKRVDRGLELAYMNTDQINRELKKYQFEDKNLTLFDVQYNTDKLKFHTSRKDEIITKNKNNPILFKFKTKPLFVYFMSNKHGKYNMYFSDKSEDINKSSNRFVDDDGLMLTARGVPYVFSMDKLIDLIYGKKVFIPI